MLRAAVVSAILLISLPAGSQAPARAPTPPGITRTQLLDNPTVLVARLRLEPGAKEVTHAATNVGSAPFEIVTIAIKPDRTPVPDMPASDAPPGVTRVPVLENAETRVARVTFSVGAAEPMHAHPFDLLIVQISSGHMGLIVGSGKEGVTGVGSEYAFFLPRNVPHAVANRGEGPLEIMSIAIK